MARLRVVINTQQAGPRLKRSYYRMADAVRTSIQQTADQVASNVLAQGRADIKRAGNFGTRWTNGLQANVTQGGGNYVVNITMAVPYWTVFQFGKTIQGKPLLWIPLSFASDVKGKRARDVGNLFRVDRDGKAPLLLSRTDRQPKFFGKEQVVIPKKFHLIEIARREARQMAVLYRQNFKRNSRV